MKRDAQRLFECAGSCFEVSYLITTVRIKRLTFSAGSRIDLPAACKTVGLLQDFSIEPEFGNTGLDLVVWWRIGLESEE